MFQIDVMSRVPVYEQIVQQAERFLVCGILQPGDKLPSVRALSVELSINPNTIQKAYAEMDRRGLVVSVPGRGIFVTEAISEQKNVVRKEKLDQLTVFLKELKELQVTEEMVTACVSEVFKETTSSEKKEGMV